MEQNSKKEQNSRIRNILLIAFVPVLILICFVLIPFVVDDALPITEGKWEKKTIGVRIQNGEIKFHFDDLKFWSHDVEVKVELETYALWGWAFVDEASFDQPYEITLILYDENSVGFEYPTKPFSRPDVEDFFAYKGFNGLSDSGFYAVINRRSLKMGSYRLGILITGLETKEEIFVLTNSRILRTPNHLRMVP